jgi:hypothetical protein
MNSGDVHHGLLYGVLIFASNIHRYLMHESLFLGSTLNSFTSRVCTLLAFQFIKEVLITPCPWKRPMDLLDSCGLVA